MIVKSGLPCSACGSSDAVSQYSDGGQYCHKCNTTLIHPVGSNLKETQDSKTSGAFNVPEEYEFSSDKVRQVPSDILRKYGVKLNPKGDTLFPVRSRDSKATGAKVCLKELNDKGKKQIRSMGDVKDSGLFGQHLFPSDGKRLVITEGEYDAMSVYHMMNKRYPVVSVVNGTGTATKDVKLNMDYIEGFQEVIICFDNDKPGQEKAKEIAHLLTPGKAHIVPLVKYKDANDYLVHGEYKEFVSAFWDKKRYQPDGIVNLADLFQSLVNQSELPSIPYPWAGLNDMLDGIRDAELVTITSGSGIDYQSL